MTAAPPHPRTVPVLVAAALLYLPFTFAGYGNDQDAHAVIEVTAPALLDEGRYNPSRFPGYIVHEIPASLLNEAGGSLLSNLGSVAAALAALALFLRILSRLEVPNRALLALTMAVHPWFWVSATATIDYLWALALILAGWDAWQERRPLRCGVLLGLAVGARLSSVFVALALLAVALRRGEADERRRALGMAVAGGVVGAGLYVPSFVKAGYTLGFLTYWIGDWGPAEHLGRFLVKSVLFWGVPAFGVLAYLAPRTLRITLRDARTAPWLLVPLLCVGAYQALYLKLPLEREYLLPLLPFVLLLVGRVCTRPVLRVLFAATLLSALAGVGVAGGPAGYRLRIEPGPIVSETLGRCRMAVERAPAAGVHTHKRENLALCRVVGATGRDGPAAALDAAGEPSYPSNPRALHRPAPLPR